MEVASYALWTAMAKPVLFGLLGLAALLGALGVASPRALVLTIATGNRWIDTWRSFQVSEKNPLRRLDRWIELDGFVLRHCRAVGTAILATAAFVGYCLVA